MEISAIKKQNTSFRGFYNSKLLKRGLEFAADNGTLFAAGTSLALSTVARPIAILSTPKTDSKNKKYACAKSISSSLVGFGLMLVASCPIAGAVKKINANPEKYLKKATISTLKNGEKSLSNSKSYSLATQIFKLGVGFALAMPKSVITCALIPPIMSKFFKKNDEKPAAREYSMTTFTGKSKDITFTGQGRLAKNIAKIIDKPLTQNFAEKFKNSNFAMHIMALTDTLSTATFINQTLSNKKIDENRKKALAYNSAISTGLSIAGGYTLDKALDKPTNKFIENFKSANINSPKLSKYVEGIKIAKPIFILGGIYYMVIPVISTFIADKLDKYYSK